MGRSWLAVLFYILLAALLIWAILKATGVIQSAAWEETIPQFLSIGLFIVLFNYLRSDIKEIRQDFKAHIDKYHSRS